MLHQNARMASSSNIPGTAQVGIIPEFSGETDDWNVYREILEEFFKANGVKNDNRVSVLISVIGADTYRTLRDLCHPTSPRDKTYDQLCTLLAKQFVPEIAIFRERARFYRAQQRRGEDVKSWYARLKKLSVDCKFGTQLEPLLLDKFVVGLVVGPIQDRLCEESERLTLKDALDLAANRESAMQDEIMAGNLYDLSLDEHRGRRGRHGRRRHRHYHDGEGRHGRQDIQGYDIGYGHGLHHHRHHQHHGPMGRHGSMWRHGAMGHYGPMGRHGMPIPPEFFRGFHEFGGRMEQRHGREMKRWARMWRKHGRRSSSSSSSSTTSSSSSSSSSDSSTDDDEQKRKCHKRGHKRGHHHGKGGRGDSKCSRKRNNESWGNKRCGRKDKNDTEENIVADNTEPELIE